MNPMLLVAILGALVVDNRDAQHLCGHPSTGLGGTPRRADPPVDRQRQSCLMAEPARRL
jgi:hypothetical protein